eukprot:TRINITY_DN26822_c0_g1_i1.p1 TRINITY_DN26822_c0_g1~~TRINITY_DN26822_c0_g1_i1.p1  ORF type:complete len:705 (+),score=175.80 TRINITY_DN26822_c0_g1_i1:284-2116(+)
MELVPGGSVTSVLKEHGPLSVAVVKRYTRSVLRALEYLHGKNIVHRDLKPSNMLLTMEGEVKLADFGISKQVRASVDPTGGPGRMPYGTPHYMAPELFTDRGFSTKSDIWGLGCVVLEMITGKIPWGELSNALAVVFHVARKGPPERPSGLPDEVNAFLDRCFQMDHRKRPSATELLRDPFLRAEGDEKDGTYGPVDISVLDSLSGHSHGRKSPSTVPQTSKSPSRTSSSTTSIPQRKTSHSVVSSRDSSPALFQAVMIGNIVRSLSIVGFGSGLKLMSYFVGSHITRRIGTGRFEKIVIRPPLDLGGIPVIRVALHTLSRVHEGDLPLFESIFDESSTLEIRTSALRSLFGNTGKESFVLLICIWEGSLDLDISPKLVRLLSDIALAGSDLRFVLFLRAGLVERKRFLEWSDLLFKSDDSFVYRWDGSDKNHEMCVKTFFSSALELERMIDEKGEGDGGCADADESDGLGGSRGSQPSVSSSQPTVDTLKGGDREASVESFSTHTPRSIGSRSRGDSRGDAYPPIIEVRVSGTVGATPVTFITHVPQNSRIRDVRSELDASLKIPGKYRLIPRDGRDVDDVNAPLGGDEIIQYVNPSTAVVHFRVVADS